MIETEGLTHLQLVVRDVHRSLAFYERVFGMQVRFWDGDRMVFIGTPGRRDTITLNQSVDVDRAGSLGGVELPPVQRTGWLRDHAALAVS